MCNKKVFGLAAAVLLAMIIGISGGACTPRNPRALVFQTDFGLKDGAVSAMKGVAFTQSTAIPLYDLTHEIPAYSIWDAAYRLFQTVEYWPAGTVFVSVVDPGVGTDRDSVVLRTKTGHYIVTPDNGTLTLVADRLGIAEVRLIDEAVNRRKNSEKSYTFHGRDVYAFTGARLAGGIISFEQVGPTKKEIVRIPYEKPRFDKDALLGTIPALDVQYGNVWTNISRETAEALQLAVNDIVQVTVFNNGKQVYTGTMPYVNSFGDVPDGQPLLYYNSLDCLSMALNMDNFAAVHKIEYGGDWTVKITKVTK